MGLWTNLKLNFSSEKGSDLRFTPMPSSKKEWPRDGARQENTSSDALAVTRSGEGGGVQLHERGHSCDGGIPERLRSAVCGANGAS
jgi:hypothetical protein